MESQKKQEEQFKNLYEFLKEKKELKIIPSMKGDWDKDKELFIKYQEELERLL